MSEAPTAKSRRSAGSVRVPRVLLGLVAAASLIALTAVPGYSANTKIYTLVVVSPMATSTSSQAIAGQSTDFFVTMTNKTPGNSNPNSFSVTAPSGFTVTAQPTISSQSNPNASATVTVVGSRVDVKSLDPVKQGQFVTLKITAAVSASASCPSVATWTAKVWTGSSLSGDQFALNNQGAPQQTSVVCAPILSVTKTPHTTQISVGGDVQFDITVSNAPGVGTAANVGVSDTLPAGLNWSIASQGLNGATNGTACSIGSGALTCTIPTLAGGSSYSVSIKAPSASAGTVTNDGVTVTLDNQTVASAGQASVTVWEGVLDCGDTVQAGNGTDSFTRGTDNKDGSDCVVVGYDYNNTVNTDNNEKTVELLWDTVSQPSATFSLTQTWLPEDSIIVTAGTVTDGRPVPSKSTQVKWDETMPFITAPACTSPDLPSQFGTLAAPLGTTDTTIQIALASGVTARNDAFNLQIGTETISILANELSLNGTTATYADIVRGAGNTTPGQYTANPTTAVMTTPFPILGTGTGAFVARMCLSASSWVSTGITGGNGNPQVQVTETILAEGDMIGKH